ncbi:CENPB protein Homeodomainlike [Phytophthora megakarya]|uniref:CENPB protein Homeodomainlike n=1 Tax=Phytophthora megakarya TaxID=4795 RepID=A0A225UQT0_9STRA|nr:CENPB protein Homeodomainlike [Phytophthora megakarya]
MYQSSGGRPGAFKASWSWRKHFFRRHRLSFRRRTREGQSTSLDGELKASEFSKEVRQKIQELGVSVVYNADQTEYVPTTTLSARGQKTVWVKCGASDGPKREPFLVFKTHPSKKIATAHENTVLRHGFGRKLWSEVEGLQMGVQIYGNSAGWWNSDLSIEFLYVQFGRRTNMHEPILLLWDDFSGHWRQDVVIFARLINVELMKVPPGYTYACQSADVTWNKLLKDAIRKRAAGVSVPFKMAPPVRRDVVAWISSAWGLLEKRTITAGFFKAKLPPRYTSPMSIQRLLAPHAAAPLEHSVVVRLRQHNIPADGISAALDIMIDDPTNDGSSVEGEDQGCIGDDERDESDLGEASRQE